MADETFLTSPMHRDLIGPANSAMGRALSMTGSFNPYAHTNLLGGVSMTPGLTYDVYGSVKSAKYKNLNSIKNIGLGVGGFIAACIAGSKFHKLFKSIGKVFKKK